MHRRRRSRRGRSPADKSPTPPAELVEELEHPGAPDADHNPKPAPAYAAAVNARAISSDKMETITARIDGLREKAKAGEISIGDAVDLAVREEMLRDPASSHGIPKLTRQTHGKIRAGD